MDGHILILMTYVRFCAKFENSYLMVWIRSSLQFNKNQVQRPDKHLEFKYYDRNQLNDKIAWGLCGGILPIHSANSPSISDLTKKL